MSDDGDRYAALREHLLAYSVRRGQFTLKSGRTSTWFIDSKQTVCRPEAMAAGEGLPFRAVLTAPDLGFPYEGG